MLFLITSKYEQIHNLRSSLTADRTINRYADMHTLCSSCTVDKNIEKMPIVFIKKSLPDVSKYNIVVYS